MPAVKRVAVVLLPVRTYCRNVLRGVVSVSAQARWECVLVPADAPPPLESLADGFLHGVIGHFAEPALAREVTRAGLPAVDIAPPTDPEPDLPNVSTDDVAVGRLAAAHLLSLGLPHFAFFGSRADYVSLLRAQGFQEAVGAAGLSCHVLLDPAGGGDGGGDGGLEAWVRGLPKPIGLLASTDGLRCRSWPCAGSWGPASPSRSPWWAWTTTTSSASWRPRR